MELKDYQKKAVEAAKPYEKFLIAMGTGLGKSLVSLSMAEKIIKMTKENMSLIIISPSSIQPSYAREISKWHIDIPNIRYVSINSGGYLYNQWTKAKNELNVSKNGNNLCVIVDELHIFSSMLAKLFKAEQQEVYGRYMKSSFEHNELLPDPSTQNDILFNNEIVGGAPFHAKESPVIKLYNDLMNMSKLTFIGLSATPIINDVFEIVPLINLCLGPEKISENYYKIPLSTNYNQFLTMPKEQWLSKLKQVKVFTAKKEDNKEEGKIPLVYEKKIILNLSTYQYAVYQNASEIERLNKMDQLKILTRLVVNFSPPERINPKMAYLDSYNVLPEDFNELSLKINAIKFYWILQFVKSHPKDLIAIYSEFIGPEGVEYLKMMFDTNNIKNLSITSKVSREHAASLIASFNTYPSPYQVIVFSSVANQGVTLKNVKHLIILEEPFNEMMTRQIIGRVARLNSHDALGDEGGEVTIYRLFANGGAPENKINENMPDYYAYSKAKKKDIEIQEILQIMGISAS